MSVYKQPNSPNFYYDFCVDGRRFRGSCKTTKVVEARAREAEKILQARKMGPESVRPRGNVLLQDVATRYFTLLVALPLAENTKRDYRYGWSKLGATRLPRVPVRSVHGDDIVLALAGIESPYVANSALRTLRVLLNKAREWGYIGECPKIELRPVDGRSEVFDDASEASLLDALSQPARDIMTILLDAGARPFEVFAIRIEDIHMGRRTIFVRRSKTKAGRRNLPVSDRMVPILAARCAGRNEGWLFPSDSASGHIESIAGAFRRARAKAGLDKRIVPYTARHTFASLMMEQTGNAFAVAKTMGHSNIKSMEPYQHHGLDSIRAAVERKNSRVMPYSTSYPASVFPGSLVSN